MTTRLTSSLLLIACLLTACGDPVESRGEGELTFAFTLLPGGCQAAGVTSLRATMGPASDPVAQQTFDCQAQVGSLVAPSGRHSLTLLGLDASDRPIFSAAPREVLVRSGEALRIPEPFELSALPGSLQVSWRFHDGRVCGAHAATHVEVIAFDASDFERARDTFPCDQGAGELQDLPAGTYTALARAVGPGEATPLAGLVEASVKRGARSRADLVLEP